MARFIDNIAYAIETYMYSIMSICVSVYMFVMGYEARALILIVVALGIQLIVNKLSDIYDIIDEISEEE